jgi:hypothetical protein
MMTCGAPIGQFDLETDRSPLGNDDGPPLWWCAAAVVIGLAVGAAFLLVLPKLPGLTRSVWCLGAGGGGCLPAGATTGRLFGLVVWASVLTATSTAVTVPLGWLAFAVARVRVTLAVTLLGPPLVWAVVVLGEPLGVSADLVHTPVVLAQTAVGCLLATVLTAPWLRIRWRWAGAVALLLATAVVIAMGYPFD